MTDADVYGSHIRTLLLTLFFRHMLPIIEKGFLYIAQPPLYKIKLGKKEQYLKDDSALKNLLFEWAGESVSLVMNSKTITSAAWHKLLESLASYETLLNKTAYDFKIAPEQCHALGALMATHAVLKKVCEKKDGEELVKLLQELITDTQISFKAIQQPEDTTIDEAPKTRGSVIFKKRAHEWQVPLEFFWSERSNQLLAALADLREYETHTVVLKMNDKERALETHGILAIIKTLGALSKPYMNIQRYKGLGEMNPEQLWETSMDPKQRQLLQVTISDTLEADAWFSTLMGDDVEGRRTFIEENGRFVKNLDV